MGRRLTNRSEAAPQGQNEAAYGDGLLHARIAHSSEEDRVEGPERVRPIGGHHLTAPEVVATAPREFLELEARVVLGLQRLHALDGLGDDLRADAVSRQHGDAMTSHSGLLAGIAPSVADRRPV